MNEDILPFIPSRPWLPIFLKNALYSVLLVFVTIRILSIFVEGYYAPLTQPQKDDPTVDSQWAPTASQVASLTRLRAIVQSRRSIIPPPDPKRPEEFVTAVLLHWKRRKGLGLVVDHLRKYPWIGEIVIWNNSPEVHLTEQDFGVGDALLPTIRVFNSPENTHDLSKHMACSLATYPTCYFNDDDWLNLHIESGWVKYKECCAPRSASELNWDSELGSEKLQHGWWEDGQTDSGSAASKHQREMKDKGYGGRGWVGGRISGNTMPWIAWEQRRWRFHRGDINLHTGFTWLGTGTFVPRHFSIRFLAQQGMAPDPISRENSLLCDMYFSLWSNSFPEQLSNELLAIDVDGPEVGWSRAVDQWSIVYTNLLDAVRKLFDVLVFQDPFLIPDPFPISKPTRESDMRAPCYTDQCLFITSLTPFPNPSRLSYPHPSHPKFSRFPWPFSSANTRTDQHGSFDPWAIEHLNSYEALFDQHPDGWPSVDWWVKRGSWHFAVDGKVPGSAREGEYDDTNDQGTCWESFRPPRTGDYFGLYLTAPIPITRITLIGSPDLVRMGNVDRVPDDRDGVVASKTGWTVWTMGNLSRVWTQRDLFGPLKTEPVLGNSDLVAITLSLDTRGQNFEKGYNDVDVDNVADERVWTERIRKIKFASQNTQLSNVTVCHIAVQNT